LLKEVEVTHMPATLGVGARLHFVHRSPSSSATGPLCVLTDSEEAFARDETKDFSLPG